MDSTSFALAVVSSWALQFVLYHGYNIYQRFRTYEDKMIDKCDEMIKESKQKILELENEIHTKIEDVSKTRDLFIAEQKKIFNQAIVEFRGTTSNGYKTSLGLMSDSRQAEMVDRILNQHESLSRHYTDMIDAVMKGRNEPFRSHNTSTVDNFRLHTINDEKEVPCREKIENIRTLFVNPQDEELSTVADKDLMSGVVYVKDC